MTQHGTTAKGLVSASARSIKGSVAESGWKPTRSVAFRRREKAVVGGGGCVKGCVWFYHVARRRQTT